MKTAYVASVALLFGLTGCDRIGALLGHGGDAGATAAAPSASASAAASAATAAPTPPPTPTAETSAGLAGFEGEIDLAMKTKTNPPFNLALLTKDDLIKVTLPPDVLAQKDLAKFTGGGNVYGVLKAHKKELTVVLDTPKKAIVIDLDQAGDRLKDLKGHRPSASGTPGASSEPPKVTKTGKMETVAGTTCEDWEIVSADKSKAQLCVANQSASFFSIPLTAVPSEQAWALELVDGKHFPLRLVSFNREGAETGRLEVTKLDRHPVDAATFEIPASYAKVTLDEMIATLGGGPPGDVPHENVPGHGRHHKHH